jgi:hypothetical protein
MTKINDILPHWPKGTVKTVKELTSLGLYPSLLQEYTKTKWIELFIKGMYKQYNDEVTWQGLLYGLQKNKESAIHAGGKTALELKGYSHYLGMGGSKVFIFSNRNLNFNLGLKKFPNIALKRTEIFDYIQETYFTDYDAGGYKIKISSPELAAMEMLYLIPAEQGFDEAYHIIEGLTSLRPNLLQSLLESCSSIKVKRLFLYMAEKAGHGWLNKLNTEKINLGSGKRMIVKGGSLNKKYNITVPKEYER